MFDDWQEQFPHFFMMHQHRISLLSMVEKELLDGLFTQLNQFHRLNDHIMNGLFSNIDVLKELNFLVDVSLKYLDNEALLSLLHSHHVHDLKSSIKKIARYAPLSTELLEFLIASPKPKTCAKFIQRCLETKMELKTALNLLKTQLTLDGLELTMELFDLSTHTYSRGNFKLLARVSAVFANPLAQTIFRARMRCFSDYSELSDPLSNPQVADHILQVVSQSYDSEEQIALFFDFLKQFRPTPETQRYMVDIDLNEKILFAVSQYCRAQISQIVSKEDYVKTCQSIKGYKTKGGDKALFDVIKYDVANSIESEDLYSTRSYEQHMIEIWEALKKPLTQLDDFEELLKSSRGYHEMLASMSLKFITPAPNTEELGQEVLKTKAAFN